MTRALVLLAVILVACGDDSVESVPEWNGIPIGGRCVGEGVCAETPGLVEADGTGGAVCSTVPGGSADVSSAERCNMLDDDCNGAVDDVSEGRCDRCEGLDATQCAACEAGDDRGIFDTCNACGDCDRIVGPGIDGFICGCESTLDCPCGFVCGEIDVVPGVSVGGCRPP